MKINFEVDLKELNLDLIYRCWKEESHGLTFLKYVEAEIDALLEWHMPKLDFSEASNKEYVKYRIEEFEKEKVNV